MNKYVNIYTYKCQVIYADNALNIYAWHVERKGLCDCV